MVNASIDQLYTLDPMTGAANLVGNTGFTGIQGLGFSPSGTLYAWDVNLGLLTVDPNTGVATDVNVAAQGTGDIQALEFTPSGTLYGARNSLFTIDTSTGVFTPVGMGGYSDVRGAGFIPEPATAVALALGFAALAARRKLR